MPTKRFLIWSLVVVAIGAVFWYRALAYPEPEATATTRVVFVTGGTDAFWQLTIQGAQAAATDHDAELQVEMPSRDEGLEQQMQILIGVDESETDGVAVSPLSAEGQTRAINLLAKKLNVVTFDSDAPLSERQYHIGTSNFGAGKMCYQLVREALPEGGKIAALISNLTKNNTIERRAGFEEAASTDDTMGADSETSSRIDVVGILLDEGDGERCRANIRQLLADYSQLKCIVGMNGYHGPILLDELRSAVRLDQIRLVVFDEADQTLDGIANGQIYATIAQDPYMYGYEAVRILTELCRGSASELPIVGGGAINVRCEAIRQDNLPDFRRKLAERLADSHSGTDTE